MTACVYCHQDKGKRECPALGGRISPSCCGENRGVRIDCPPECRYYLKNEEYQRGRWAPEFHEIWIGQTEPFYRQRQTEILDFIVYLEIAIYRYFLEETRGTDDDLLDALHHVKRKLSPIQVIESPSSRLGQHLWEAVEEHHRHGRGIDADEGQEATEALVETVRSLMNDGEPRRALHGLLGHVEHYLGVPEGIDEEERQKTIETPRIITPR